MCERHTLLGRLDPLYSLVVISHLFLISSLATFLVSLVSIRISIASFTSFLSLYLPLALLQQHQGCCGSRCLMRDAEEEMPTSVLRSALNILIQSCSSKHSPRVRHQRGLTQRCSHSTLRRKLHEPKFRYHSQNQSLISKLLIPSRPVLCSV